MSNWNSTLVWGTGVWSGVAPSTPTGLTATTVSSTRVDLSWTAATDDVGVTGYTVRRGGVVVATLGPVISYSDTGLTPSTSYSWTVDAFDADGNHSSQSSAANATTQAAGPPAASIFGTGVFGSSAFGTSTGGYGVAVYGTDVYGSSAPDTTVPSVPQNLAANVVSSARIDLSWTAATDNVGVTGYTLYRGGVALVSLGPVTSYSDTSVSASTNYLYRIDAFDAAGNRSTQSNSVSATTPSAADTTPPSVPSGLTATTVGPSQVNLNWVTATDNVAVTGYVVRRGVTVIATLGAVTSYSDTGLSPSTIYSWTVDAFDAAGNHSAQSSSASATTQAPSGDVTAPTVPTGLNAAAINWARVDLSWTAATDNVAVTGYGLYRNGSLLVSLGSVTSYSDTSVAAGTAYSYRIDAFDAAGNRSAQSTAAGVTTPAAPVSPPVAVPSLPGALLRLGPVVSTAGTTYDGGQVGSLLVQPSLQMRWQFDLLSPSLNWKADLTPLVDNATPPVLDHDSTRAVMRNLRINFWRPVAAADVLQDLIRMRYQILAPDGGWLEWVIGLHRFQAPTKTISEAASGWQVNAPDLASLLVNAAFTTSFSVSGGISCAQAVSQIVGTYGGSVPLRVSIPDNGSRLSGTQDWDAGTSRVKAINDILNAFAYSPMWMDGATLRSAPIPDYTSLAPECVFDTTQGPTALLSPITESSDYSNAFNQFRVIGEDPRRVKVVQGYYENRNPASPTSITSQGPRMAPVINDSKIPDDFSADARAKAEARNAARVFATLSLPVLPWPFGQNLGVYRVVINTTDEGVVARNYLNTRWQHTCAAGAPTVLEVQRLLPA